MFKKRQLIIIVIALFIPIIPFVVLGELPGEQWLSAYDDNSLFFGLMGASLLLSDILLPIPSSIIGNLLGARLGVFQGWLWTWLGLSVGNLIGFYIGRIWPEKYQSMLAEKPTLYVLLISRPIPVIAEVVVFTCGAVRMSISHFIGVMLLGNCYYALGLVCIGAAFISDSSALYAFLGLVLLPVIFWLLWGFSRRRANLKH